MEPTDRPERGPPPDDGPRAWPLHQRLAGAAVRAGLASLGLVPLLLFVAVTDGARVLLALPFVAAVAGLLFALERRDATGPGTIGRVALAAAAAQLVLPAAALWLVNAGDPERALRGLERGLDDALRALPFLLPGVALLANVLGLLFHVRRVTDALGPQLAAGLIPAAGLAALVVLVGVDPEKPLVVGLLLAGALVPLLAAQGDHLAAPLDPAGPRPAGGSVRRVFAVWAVCTLGALCVATAVVVPALSRHHHRGAEAPAIGSLRTLLSAQVVFREGDKDGDGVLDYAADLAELSQAALIDPVLGGGVKQGYRFRIVRSATTPEHLWAATADPVAPGTTGDRFFATTHAGVIYYTTSGPIPIDPATCDVPPTVLPVGR